MNKHNELGKAFAISVAKALLFLTLQVGADIIRPPTAPR
jgi:hypothetical protein